MITANELRIGNWVKWQSTLIHITSHNLFNRTVLKCNEGRCFGIPLTPEILEKASLTKGKLIDEDCYYSELVTFIATQNGVKLYVEIESDDYYSTPYGKGIKYLHQLQNLYFALTQTELEIKL